MDALVPHNALIGRPIELLVQVRLVTSPRLARHDWPSPDPPAKIYKASDHAEFFFARRPGGTLGPSQLVVKVIAPAFAFSSDSEKTVTVPPTGQSPLLSFLLVPRQAGVHRINVELYDLTKIQIGNLAISTAVATEEAAQPSASLELDVRVADEYAVAKRASTLTQRRLILVFIGSTLLAVVAPLLYHSRMPASVTYSGRTSIYGVNVTAGTIKVFDSASNQLVADATVSANGLFTLQFPATDQELYMLATIKQPVQFESERMQLIERVDFYPVIPWEAVEAQFKQGDGATLIQNAIRDSRSIEIRGKLIRHFPDPFLVLESEQEIVPTDDGFKHLRFHVELEAKPSRELPRDPITIRGQPGQYLRNLRELKLHKCIIVRE